MLNKGADASDIARGDKSVRCKMAGMITVKAEGPKRGGGVCIVDGCDNGVKKRAEALLFFLLLFIFRLVSAGLGVDGGRADRCGVSIARILSSISDNHHDAVMDQWEAGEGRRQQKQVNDGNGRRISEQRVKTHETLGNKG